MVILPLYCTVGLYCTAAILNAEDDRKARRIPLAAAVVARKNQAAPFELDTGQDTAHNPVQIQVLVLEGIGLRPQSPEAVEA